jgi:hypothetical protein
MANPNPNPATRFGAGQANGSRGRQRAARDKISAAFLEALSDTFHEPNDTGGCKGLDALKKVRDEDPATFARIFASLMPKQLEIDDAPPEANLSDEQLEAFYLELGAQIAAKAEGKNAAESPTPTPATRVN